MYAIIRTGGKQAKVRAGDVIDVERLRAEDEVTFTPLLVVEEDGTVISGRDELADVKVVAKVLGPSAGPKIDIFKYKAKTGYRRRQGHRQKYTRIEIVGISNAAAGKPAAEKKVEAKPAAEPEAKAEAKPEAKSAKADEKPKAAAEPEAKAEAKPEAKAEAKPEAKKAKAAAKPADTESADTDDAAAADESAAGEEE